MLKTYSSRKYYIYKSRDDKWHVFPKLSTVADIFKDAKKDPKDFMSSVPKMIVTKGQEILYRTLNGDNHNAIIDSIDDSNIKIKYNINGKDYFVEESVEDLDWL